MAKGYRFVNHTADVEFVASGKSAEEAFNNALAALFCTVSYVRKVSAAKSKGRVFALRERARDLDGLLWYSLQDALSITDSNDVFAYRASGLRIMHTGKGYSLAAKIHAKARSDDTSKLDVKGVSGYDLKVWQSGARFMARAVLDV